MRKSILLSSCLFLSLLATHASAQTTTNVYWSLSGSAPSGTWDSTEWSTSSTGTPVAGWADTTVGNFPEFSAGTAATGSYTITANSPHTIAGMLVTPTTGTVTITGAGQLTISTSNPFQGFFSTGTLVINNVLAGAGGIVGQTGSLELLGNNTYQGGTELDGTLIYFNNNNSFGTGPIIPILTGFNPGYSALLTTGNTPITLPNAFQITTPSSGINFVCGVPVILTGNWNVADTAFIENSGASANTLTLSGVLSGAGGLVLAGHNNNSGEIILSGANTYAGGTVIGAGLTTSTVILAVGMDGATSGAAGNLGAVPGSFQSANILLGTNTGYAGILLATNSFTLHANRGITLNTNSTIEAASGQTLTIAGPITTGGYGLTIGGTGKTGTVSFSGLNTYGDPTTISAGATLAISGAGELGSGGFYAGAITDNGTLLYNSSATQNLNGNISGSGTVIQSGPGLLALNGNCTYTGVTLISASTLYLFGTIDSSEVSIAAGGTFDVSYLSSPYNQSTPLSASGTSSPATLNGPSGGTINLQSQPIDLTYDGTDVPLTVTFSGGSGTLSLGNNWITVNNQGLPLTTGTYPMITVAGTVNLTGGCLADVTGNGVAAGNVAVIQVSGGTVNLVVQAQANNSPVWNGGNIGADYNWSDGLNWMSGTPPDLAGDNVTFAGATGTNAPVMNNSYSVSGLTFDSTAGSFTLTNAGGGQVLGVSVGVTNNSSFEQNLAMPVDLLTNQSQWFIPNAAASITVSNNITDDGNGLALTGSGTLVLASTNDLTGSITTGAGSTLEILGAADLGDNGLNAGVYPGTITDNGTLIYNNSLPQTFSGPITVGSSGAFTINNTGSAAETFTGPISISGLFTDNNTGTAVQTLTGSFTINTGGTFTDNSAVSQAILVPTITNNGTINYNCAASQSFPVIITGSGSLVVNGNGVSGQGQLTLTGANTYTGTTTIGNDWIAISADNNLGTPPSSPVANQLILSNNILGAGNAGNFFGIRANNGSFSLSPNRGIYLALGGAGGANGGSFNVQGGFTLTIPGIISGPGAFFSGPASAEGNGTNLLSGANTYQGGTIIGDGTLQLGANNTLPVGMPLTIYAATTSGQPGAALLNMAGFNQTIGALTGISTGLGGSATGTPTINLTGALTVIETNIGTTFAGIMNSSGGSLTITVPSGGTGSTLTLSKANTYTGNTTINMASGANSGPTLLLSSTGSITSTGNISIGAGATLDVSAYAAYTLSSSTTLGASGTGTALGTTAAAINGASGGTVNLGSQPMSLTYSSSGPALYISQGALALNNNPIAVINPGSPLSAGTYLLVQQAAGNISGSLNGAVVVTGAGLASGYTASVQISSGNVNLVVAGPSQTDVWNGGATPGNYTWSDGGASGNWSTGAAPNLSGDNVYFAGTTGTASPVMNSSYAVNSLTFNSGAGAFILTNDGFASGHILTVGSGVTNSSTSLQTLEIPVKLLSDGGPTFTSQWNFSAGAGNITLTTNLTDGGAGAGLTVSGPGTLTLMRTNSITGPIAISTGSTLAITGAGQLTSAAYDISPNVAIATNNSAITINSGATLLYGSSSPQYLFGNVTNNGTLQWNEAAAAGNFNGALYGNGSVVLNSVLGGIDLAVNVNNASYTGTWTIDLGYLQGTTDLRFGAAPATLVPNFFTINSPTTQQSGLRIGGSITLSANRGITLAAGNIAGVQATSGITAILPNPITGPGNMAIGGSWSTGYGTIIVSNSANNYTGRTQIVAGTLVLGVPNALPAGTPLSICSAEVACTFNMNGHSQTIGPLSTNAYVGSSPSSLLTPTINLSGALTVIETNVNTTFGGIITNNGGSLTITNGGPSSTSSVLTLDGTNTYTGPTTIGASTLQVSGLGSISNTASLSIGAGGTLDVSALSVNTFYLSASTTLSASGSGTALGTTAAAINGASGGTVNLGSQGIALAFIPQTFTGDTTHPALDISQGALTLSGNTITVNNTSGTPLGAGTYVLIQVAGGTINGNPSATATVTGAGLAANTTASISTGTGPLVGTVDLVVVSTLVTPTFSGLASLSIPHGAPSVALSGTVSATGPVYPVSGETDISAMINGHTVSGSFINGSGGFLINYNDPSLATDPVGPYTVTYSYGGDSSLNPASDSTTTLTITNSFPPITNTVTTNGSGGIIVCWPSIPGVYYNVLTNGTLATNSSPTNGWTDVGSLSSPASPVEASSTETCVTLPGPLPSPLFVLIKQNSN